MTRFNFTIKKRDGTEIDGCSLGFRDGFVTDSIAIKTARNYCILNKIHPVDIHIYSSKCQTNEQENLVQT